MRLYPILSLGFLGLAMQLSIPAAFTQPKEANYDEAKVPKYELPDPLVCSDGTKVTTPEQWNETRRPEILALFEEHMFGKTPTQKVDIRTGNVQENEALDGKAIRKQVTLTVTGKAGELPIEVLIYLPKDAPRPVPIFLGPNFRGNHTVHADPGIRIGETWLKLWKESPETKETDPETTRGTTASRWPIEKILARGYGVATVCYEEIDPDRDRFQDGVHPFFYKEGQTQPGPGEWGSIGAWAWGLSRILDYLETDKDIDAKRVALIGHSRLGKTALWAGAQDPRFALVISNDSGCGGAALSRRAFGETVERINTAFPHWFCDNFNRYNGKENDLPIDQHMLIALIAPRPVCVASAAEDLWADPRGEFLGAKHADPVYKLLGTDGLPAEEMPAVDQPVRGTISYHIRTGKHDVTDFDWDQYMDAADKYMKK